MSTKSPMQALSDCFPSSSCILLREYWNLAPNNNNIRVKIWLPFKTWCSLCVPRCTDVCKYQLQDALMFANTNFMKPGAKLWTFQHPSGSRSQIDCILIRKKWRNSMRNCQANSSFSSIGSDHRIVSCITLPKS